MAQYSIKWTDEEDNILRYYYPSYPREEIMNLLPGRSWDAVKLHARKLGIKKDRQQTNTDIHKLLDGSHESYYWCGFIMADGAFEERPRLKITLAKRDEDHVIKFMNFVNCKNNLSYGPESRSIIIMDTTDIPKIKKFLGANRNKTYKPPINLPEGDEDHLLSFIIGFIDGDGSVQRKTEYNCSLSVKIHSSWLSILQNMANIVYQAAEINSGWPKINNAGYAYWDISRSEVCQFLYRKTVEHGLPVLNRKWDKVPLQYNKASRGKNRTEKVKELADQGLTVSQISKILDLKYATVNAITYRNSIYVAKRDYNRKTKHKSTKD